MPLIVLCGIPGAGKTVVASALTQYVQMQSQLSLRCITEASVNRTRVEAYKDALQEKITRSALRSAVEKVVDKDTIVILDALNYIKGLRYELYCKARAESTTYCLIYVDTPLELAVQRNEARDDRYDATIIQGIAARFELPDEKNRWDRPLFHLNLAQELNVSRPMDLNDDVCKLLQLKNIYNYTISGKCVKAGTATIAPVVAPCDFLTNLNNQTRQILDQIVAQQRQNLASDTIRIQSQNGPKLFRVGRKASMAELQRHRRQFMKLLESRPCSADDIAKLFVDFLQKQLA